MDTPDTPISTDTVPPVREVSDVVSLLPRVTEPAAISRTDLGVEYVQDLQPRYVPPPLELVEMRDLDATVVLVSAPAAVGKTAMARELAARTGNSYWDLGRFKVADNFLAGTIGKVFGYGQTGEFLAGVSRGAHAVILDGLDEASVGSGNTANFEAFLRGTGELIAECAPPRPGAVMFARDETAFFVREFLREGGARVLHLRIDYFDRERSLRFLHQTVTGRTAPAPQIASNAYEEAVVVIFGTLAKLLGASDDPWGDRSRSFTGYAPVLAAIAAYLCAVEHNDYRAAVEELMSNDSLWSFLERIVLGILEREQAKLRRATAEVLELDFAADAYTPSEQLRLLLSPRLDKAYIYPPADLPKADQGQFIEAARQQLDEHPFLASRTASFAHRFVNPAFRDYALAAALAGDDQSLVDAAVAGTRISDFQASPLLAFFLLLKLERTGHAMTAEMFTAFYESLISRREGLRLELTDDESSADVAHGTVRRIGEGHVPNMPGTPVSLGSDAVTQFNVTGLSATPLRFRTRVRNVLVDHAHAAIVLGEPRVSVTIGPDVDISTDIVRVEAADVAFSADDGPVALACNTFEDRSGGVPPHIFGDNAGIVVVAPRVAYPWDQFQPSQGDGLSSPALAHACDELWQMAKWFKGGIVSGVTYHKPTLDLIAKRGKISMAFLEYARETKLVTVKGAYYTLHPEVAHVNLQQVKQRVVTPELAGYLRRYIEKRSGRVKR